ncbi:hypothetical protein ACJX0J_022358, partial [Zea mays]
MFARCLYNKFQHNDAISMNLWIVRWLESNIKSKIKGGHIEVLNHFGYIYNTIPNEWAKELHYKYKFEEEFGEPSDMWLDYIEAKCNEILGNYSKPKAKALQQA